MVNQGMSDIYRSATVLRANPFRSLKWDNRLGKSSCCADVGWNFPGENSYAIFCAWFCILCSGGGFSCWRASYGRASKPCAEETSVGLVFTRLVQSVPELDGSLEVKYPPSALSCEQAIYCASFQPSWTCKLSQFDCKRWLCILDWLFLSLTGQCQVVNRLLEGHCLLQPSSSSLCFFDLHGALEQ